MYTRVLDKAPLEINSIFQVYIVHNTNGTNFSIIKYYETCNGIIEPRDISQTLASVLLRIPVILVGELICTSFF